MRPTPALVAAYLLATLPPLLASRPDTVGAALAVGHLVGAALFLVDARRPRAGAPTLRDWLPVFVAPLLYFELPLLNQWAGPGYHDALVQRWEDALFAGADPSRRWAGAMPWRWLSEPLHAAYVSYYPLVVLPLVPHWLRGRGPAFRATAFAVVAAFLACFLVFVLFPVQGPRYLGTPEGIPSGPFRSLALALLEGGSSRGAAFPSSHVAVAAAQGVLAVRFWGRRGWAVAVLAALLAAGAVYGGFHYAVDAVAGAVVGGGAAWLGLRAVPVEARGEEA